MRPSIFLADRDDTSTAGGAGGAGSGARSTAGTGRVRSAEGVELGQAAQDILLDFPLLALKPLLLRLGPKILKLLLDYLRGRGAQWSARTPPLL